MSAPPLASLPLNHGSTSSTPATAKKPVKSRMSNAVIAYLKEYHQTTERPTKEQLDELYAKVNALPNEAGQNTLQSLKKWFYRRNREQLKKAASTGEEPPPNPRCPSLTQNDIEELSACWKHAKPELRPGLYQSWIESASWERADKVDLAQWIDDRAALENNLPLPPLRRPLAPPPLRIDTTAASSSPAYAHKSLPTPSDTTSPEPFFPESASSASASTGRAGSSSAYPYPRGTNVRYHPYPRLPTPASSRAASLALKSEPALSPVMFTHVGLPPVSASAMSAPFSIASTASAYFSNISAKNSSFVATPATPPPPPTSVPFGTRALQSVRRFLEEQRVNPGPEPPVPTNHVEFIAAMAPYGQLMEGLIVELQSINWDIPTGPPLFFCVFILILWLQRRGDQTKRKETKREKHEEFFLCHVLQAGPLFSRHTSMHACIITHPPFFLATLQFERYH
ncbi:hypothetical protein C8F04DRAFT_1396006 [Mycena alexandri]|uniref:Homeobox domain-containing protein n=1 Tax=Mycena alexandri TaxID=1745969 RepID=A0AAD6STF2_9AGAR|nr:hypothetical protein C8F04DRAFT_1396006 [Mycena alexandri]